MRVLVTGGAGYIGSVMSGMLADRGHEVLVIDNLSRGHRKALEDIPLEEIDLLDAPAVTAACLGFRPGVAMHFAGHSLVDESVSNPLKYLRENLAMGLNLLQGLERADCRALIFSSSCSIFGVPSVELISEDTPTDPINPYGLSKLLFERILCELEKRGRLGFASLRYFNAAGADTVRGLGEDHTPETHLIPRVVSAALGKAPAVRIFGTDYPTPDGTCVRDYVHIVDLCDAHLRAMEELNAGARRLVFNVGIGRGFSVREVVESVKRVSGVDFTVIEESRREGDPPRLVASPDRIKAELGWRPAYTELDEIVSTAWQWHSTHPEGYPG